MQNDAIVLVKALSETVSNDIEACEMMMGECKEDPETCEALTSPRRSTKR